MLTGILIGLGTEGFALFFALAICRMAKDDYGPDVAGSGFAQQLGRPQAPQQR
jgi:hypothetical protein